MILDLALKDPARGGIILDAELASMLDTSLRDLQTLADDLPGQLATRTRPAALSIPARPASERRFAKRSKQRMVSVSRCPLSKPSPDHGTPPSSPERSQTSPRLPTAVAPVPAISAAPSPVQTRSASFSPAASMAATRSPSVPTSASASSVPGRSSSQWVVTSQSTAARALPASLFGYLRPSPLSFEASHDLRNPLRRPP